MCSSTLHFEGDKYLKLRSCFSIFHHHFSVLLLLQVHFCGLDWTNYHNGTTQTKSPLAPSVQALTPRDHRSTVRCWVEADCSLKATVLYTKYHTYHCIQYDNFLTSSFVMLKMVCCLNYALSILYMNTFRTTLFSLSLERIDPVITLVHCMNYISFNMDALFSL